MVKKNKKLHQKKYKNTKIKIKKIKIQKEYVQTQPAMDVQKFYILVDNNKLNRCYHGGNVTHG